MGAARVARVLVSGPARHRAAELPRRLRRSVELVLRQQPGRPRLDAEAGQADSSAHSGTVCRNHRAYRLPAASPGRGTDHLATDVLDRGRRTGTDPLAGRAHRSTALSVPVTTERLERSRAPRLQSTGNTLSLMNTDRPVEIKPQIAQTEPDRTIGPQITQIPRPPGRTSASFPVGALLRVLVVLLAETGICLHLCDLWAVTLICVHLCDLRFDFLTCVHSVNSRATCLDSVRV
jgi:hypothetical protein